MRSSTRLLLGLSLTIIALGMLAWLVSSVGELHDRVARHSPELALGLIGVAALAVVAATGSAALVFWRLSRPESSAKAEAPEDVIQAAVVQAEKAELVVNQVGDEGVRAYLASELSTLRADRERRQFHLVVFGTGSSGKTSLISALLGRPVGATEAVMGTTKHGEKHAYRLEGVEGTLVVTDTPGLSEVGEGGALREAEARDLAARADLLLFVVDHDLIRSEHEPLIALARQGKRSIVVFNKKDRFSDADRETILTKLRERLAGVVPPEDVVSVAAAPRPLPVRVRQPDGSVETVFEPEPPDLGDLRARIGAVLDREGDELRAGNLLLRAHMISKAAQDQLTRERRAKAEAVIDRFQWITAGAALANPLPALELMATGAVQLQMICELAAVYGVAITTAHARTIGSQVIRTLLKLGLVETATSLVAGLFKSSLVGYAAGGAIQGTTMAYLTHISGHAITDYFERGQSWGDGGVQAELIRVFDLNSRAEFLQEFARQALERVVRRVGGAKAEARQG